MWHPIRRAQGSVQGHRATCRDTKSCAGTQRSLQKCKIMCRDTKECAGTQRSFQGHRVEWRNTKGCSETRSDVWGQKGECRDTKVVPGTQKEMWTHQVLLRDTEEPASLTTEGLWSSMSKPSTLWCTAALFPGCGWCGCWSCACRAPLLCRAHSSHLLAWTADLHGCHPLRAYKSMNQHMDINMTACFVWSHSLKIHTEPF